MMIKTTQLFKHDAVTFEAEKTYDVPDALGFYFVNNGWATADGVEGLPTLSSEHVVEVHSGTLGTTSK